MKDIENRSDIEFLIDEFYKQVIEDETIGFFFTKIVRLNWEDHIPIMYDFWDSVLFGVQKYKGNPMIKHIVLNEKHPMEPRHFDQWLSLWVSTIQSNFKGDNAEGAIKRARQIAELMKFKISQTTALNISKNNTPEE